MRALWSAALAAAPLTRTLGGGKVNGRISALISVVTGELCLTRRASIGDGGPLVQNAALY